MKKIQNLHELFIEQLQDRYDAAQQQILAFSKLAAACTDEELKRILQADIEVSRRHQDQLKNVFDQLGEDPAGEQCEGTAGLIHEANELLDYAEGEDIINQGIAISIQHINHHDIAGYNGCMLYAKALGKSEIHAVVKEMFEDAKGMDVSLNDFIAKSIVNN
ncbi:MAG: DUF892 family protein [Bacteroidota bacterium]